MNPIIANERNKKKCQKFTPLNKVEDMLDLAGYSRDLFGKKVLEYSFGSGNIIKQIVKRYVEDALSQNIDVNNIPLDCLLTFMVLNLIHNCTINASAISMKS